jgi:hypothetical protein
MSGAAKKIQTAAQQLAPSGYERPIESLRSQSTDYEWDISPNTSKEHIVPQGAEFEADRLGASIGNEVLSE